MTDIHTYIHTFIGGDLVIGGEKLESSVDLPSTELFPSTSHLSEKVGNKSAVQALDFLNFQKQIDPKISQFSVFWMTLVPDYA